MLKRHPLCTPLAQLVKLQQKRASPILEIQKAGERHSMPVHRGRERSREASGDVESCEATQGIALLANRLAEGDLNTLKEMYVRYVMTEHGRDNDGRHHPERSAGTIPAKLHSQGHRVVERVRCQ